MSPPTQSVGRAQSWAAYWKGLTMKKFVIAIVSASLFTTAAIAADSAAKAGVGVGVKVDTSGAQKVGTGAAGKGKEVGAATTTTTTTTTTTVVTTAVDAGTTLKNQGQEKAAAARDMAAEHKAEGHAKAMAAHDAGTAMAHDAAKADVSVKTNAKVGAPGVKVKQTTKVKAGTEAK